MDVSGWKVKFFLPYHREDLYGENFNARRGLFRPWVHEHFGLLDFSKTAGKWRWVIQDGEFIEEGSGRTYGAVIKFRYPEDAMLFKLRWL